jgi:hypothetical protein
MGLFGRLIYNYNEQVVGESSFGFIPNDKINIKVRPLVEYKLF